MPRVTKDSWKTLPAPEQREAIPYDVVFTDVEGDLLVRGLRPRAMEDKWFIYFEDDWLCLHRSWTGSLIFWLKLDGCPAGVRVTKAWVNRDPEQYRETDSSYDGMMLDFLIRRLLLHQDAEFPVRPTDVANSPKGVFQHHIVGRAYPERKVGGDS